MSDPRAVPSLDEVIPEQAAELAPDIARALLRRCSEEQRRLAELHDALMIAAFANGAAHRETRDRFLDADEVGTMIGKSRSWVEKNTEILPKRRKVGGEGKWSEREVQQWMRYRETWKEE
jgi:predicted DNA-binding transcriptional regulator AlpA